MADYKRGDTATCSVSQLAVSPLLKSDMETSVFPVLILWDGTNCDFPSLGDFSKGQAPSGGLKHRIGLKRGEIHVVQQRKQ